jgi:uncharacterized protein (TIGR04255 family)
MSFALRLCGWFIVLMCGLFADSLRKCTCRANSTKPFPQLEGGSEPLYDSGMDKRHYDHAPITEAIIDVRVKPREGLKLAALEKVREADEGVYPEVRKVAIAHGHLEVGERVAASATQQQTGFAFTSSDQKQVLQVRMDGFGFSRLAPYETWEKCRDEARRLWTKYREQVTPLGVNRLAVRYINRFDLPGTQVEMKDYFRTTPEISPDLPQFMNGFFMRVAIPQDDLKSVLLINQTIVPPARPDVTSVVLDIDLFRETEVPGDEESMWEFFEKLRDRKNEVFEACITENARRLIR